MSRRIVPETLEQTNIKELERDVAKKKLENEKQLEEELNYLAFPTIMGWYFDGVFTEPFGLNEDYAVQFNELQAELDIIADYEQDETFTEKARRNFWPPKFFGCCFRGRGIYLDFLEIRKDPPHSPLEINYEPKHELIGVACDDDGKDDEDGTGDNEPIITHRKIITAAGDQRVVLTDNKQIKRAKEDYYWDHYSGSFLPKNPDQDYYYDENQLIWRSFVGYVRRTPYSYYYDFDEGTYTLKNRKKWKDFYWDPDQNVWKKYGQKGPPESGCAVTDFFWDENSTRWIPLKKRIGAIQDYPGGKRKIKRGTRGLSGRHEEDYFYDSATGSMQVKDFTPKPSGKVTDYIYDPWENKWRERNKDPQHVQGYHPSDYVWNAVSGAWNLRPEKERRMVTPYDYFFDDALGRFYPREMPKREQYFWDKVVVNFRQKDVSGPSSNGLNCGDYCWDEDKLVWSLIESQKADVEDQLTIKRKIIKGKRGRSGKAADDYYYDGVSGKFIPKEALKFERYVFDPIEEVWRKDKQPYGPGKSGLYPDEYYFDQLSGVWRERSDNSKIRQPSEESVFHSSYDYFFDWDSGKFMERNEHDRAAYSYDTMYHCYVKVTPVVKGKHKKTAKQRTPHDYYFDEYEEAWFAFDESPNAREVEDYSNGGGRRTRFGPRGENGLCPDDWYFDTTDEKFKQKHEGMEYEYFVGSGIWILPGTSKLIQRSKLHPDDFYFSDAKGVFRQKSEQHDQIYLDKNARIWREKRHKPFEYSWNDGAGFYILNEDAGKYSASGKKKIPKKPKKKKTTQEVMQAVNMDDYRPDWEHPKAEEINQEKRGRYKDLKKPVSWTDPAYQHSERRLHHDRPGQIIM